MEKRILLDKILVTTGVILVWLPILAPIFLSLAFLIAHGQFRFDYLMPAELFLFALVGSALLIWVSLRVKSHTKLVGWALAITVGMLVGAQAIAEVTGLASGAIEPAGGWFVLVLTMLGFFNLALIAVGVGGILLLRQVYRLTSKKHQSTITPLVLNRVL